MQLRRPYNIPIDLIRSLLAVCERGSFSGAAEELHLTQPAISGQIKRLERLMGGDLFVKTARGLGLTDLGQDVQRYGRRMLALNDQVIALAGKVPRYETIYLGIQNIFARIVLAGVVDKCQPTNTRQYKIISGGALELAEKLRSGYIDLTFMLTDTESRRNLLAEWTEQMVWARAPHHFPVAEGEPIPLVGRENGFMDRKVMDLLDDRDIPYRVVFSSPDLGVLVAAVESGIGLMIVPERYMPQPLISARDRILPKLPQLRAGVFCKEGFDIARNRALVDSFVAAVQPPNGSGARPNRRR